MYVKGIDFHVEQFPSLLKELFAQLPLTAEFFSAFFLVVLPYPIQPAASWSVYRNGCARSDILAFSDWAIGRGAIKWSCESKQGLLFRYNIRASLSSAESQGGESAEQGTRGSAITLHKGHILTPYRSQPIEADHLTDNRTSAEERASVRIGHIRKYHNTLCLSPQILNKHCFQFLLVFTVVPRENKTMLIQKFGGTNKEFYGIFRSGRRGISNLVLRVDHRSFSDQWSRGTKTQGWDCAMSKGKTYANFQGLPCCWEHGAKRQPGTRQPICDW